MDETRTAGLLQDVRRDIAALAAEMDELRRLENYLSKKLSPARQTSSATHTQLGSDGPSLSGSQGLLPVNMSINPAATEYGHNLTQSQLAESVLKKVGHPMNTQDIVEEMIRAGYQERGDRKQLVNSVFSAMRRNPRFAKLGRGLWGLKEWLGERVPETQELDYKDEEEVVGE